MATLNTRRVLIPIDPADIPYQALEFASGLVESIDDTHILAVLPAIENSAGDYTWGTIDGESRTDYALRNLALRLKDTGYANARLHVVFGDPSVEITALATRLAADLVVLPCRTQRSRLTRLLKGAGIAEKLVRIAPCPVLVLPLDPETIDARLSGTDAAPVVAPRL